MVNKNEPRSKRLKSVDGQLTDMKATINVTQRDINKAIKENRGDCCGCPIYNAIQRVKKLKDYIVGMYDLYSDPSILPTIMLPVEAQRLSRASHAHLWKEVKPLKFQVELPA